MKYETNEKIDDEVDEDGLYEIEKNILYEKKWRKRVFECKLKYIYDIKRLDDMNCIHNKKVNKRAE